MRVNQGSGRIFAACHWQGSQFLNVGRLKAHHECMLQGSRRIKSLSPQPRWTGRRFPARGYWPVSSVRTAPRRMQLRLLLLRNCLTRHLPRLLLLRRPSKSLLSEYMLSVLFCVSKTKVGCCSTGLSHSVTESLIILPKQFVWYVWVSIQVSWMAEQQETMHFCGYWQ